MLIANFYLLFLHEFNIDECMIGVKISASNDHHITTNPWGLMRATIFSQGFESVSSLWGLLIDQTLKPLLMSLLWRKVMFMSPCVQALNPLSHLWFGIGNS